MEGLKKLRYRLTGVSGLIMHNGQLANPRNKWSKAIKEVSSKRTKTESDFDKMAELEFMGSLYLNEDLVPVLPPEGIEAIVRSGAKKSKDGKVAQSGCFCYDGAVLEYDGPKDMKELWEDERFVLSVGAKVGQARIIRTRPIFEDWAADIELSINQELCSEAQVTQWLEVAGVQCGAFDWRPRYGRFTVENISERKAA